MFFLYNLLVIITGFALKAVAFFNPKMKLFVEGRKNVFKTLGNKIQPKDKTIWFHSASLGEFEQGLPVMEKIRTLYPDHKIVLTFFSPSGYEVRKNSTVADVIVYLPLDTKSNAEKFLKLVHPEMAFFIKYEYWPNYLNALKERNIPTYLFSGIFRKDQVFFKWYGGFYRKALTAFKQFFVQNESSKLLLQQIGFNNVKVSGDTRFDRVLKILERDNSLDFVEKFKNNQLTIVCGSTWPKDEVQLLDFINTNSFGVKFIIAPHNVKPEQISELKNSISKKTILFSELKNKNLADYDVFIIDTIGILTKIYSYADIAYVGGGFGTSGLHNILEPATFGIPIVIGPNYQKFSEAVALVNMGGCISVKNKKELEETLSLLIQNEDERFEKGHISSTFVQMNKNATEVILKNL
ncbi:3-deoxy-D-manno-octulosonic acid transferase [Flavobacterium sp. WW92]|uniref:3-deoxy-D-manno-octulosonic acid transferase n=1 Tax=unclassified Flavobacterium TaxID=196869 RepID=UPI0022255C72|nr:MULTISPECIES: glycosyltransferase N-terminal domain-containing protein [unclassified Flavobacterium]WDO13332.1 3-deoxy-D-manno-octulosonic acid transferase [Flavobacterium sp. WW92]